MYPTATGFNANIAYWSLMVMQNTDWLISPGSYIIIETLNTMNQIIAGNISGFVVMSVHCHFTL